MIEKFKTWLAQPFSVDMTAVEWFAFIGLLIIIIFLWNLVLLEITRLLNSQA